MRSLSSISRLHVLHAESIVWPGILPRSFKRYCPSAVGHPLNPYCQVAYPVCDPAAISTGLSLSLGLPQTGHFPTYSCDQCKGCSNSLFILSETRTIWLFFAVFDGYSTWSPSWSAHCCSLLISIAKHICCCSRVRWYIGLHSVYHPR